MNKNLFSLAMGTIASSFASSILWVVLPLYMWDLGFTFFDMGIMYALQSLIMVIFSRFFGIWADKTGKKKFIIIGNITTIIAYTIVYLYITSYNSLSLSILLIFSTILGLGWSLNSGAFAAAITTVLSRTRTELATGIYLSADAVGWTIGSFLSGILIDAFGIIPVLSTAILALILGLLVIAVGYKEESLARKVSITRMFREAWSFKVRGSRELTLVFLINVFLSLGASIYFLVFIIKFYIILGSKSLYGIVTGVAGVFGIIAPYVAGKLGENSIDKVLAAALATRIAFMAYLSFSWDYIAAIIFWLVPLWGIINVGIISLTTRFSWEGYESEAHAIRTLLMQIATTIGNVIGAFLVETLKINTNLANLWIILIIGTIIYALGLLTTIPIITSKKRRMG